MSSKDQNTSEDSGMSLEELAREAMDAIKKSERDEQTKEEIRFKKELEKKEAILKEEINQKIKRKLRRLEKEEAKKPKEDVQDPRLMVNWSNPDEVGITYEGHYNENYTFRIKRGLNLYHLYVEDRKLMIEAWQRSTCTSIDLFTLKLKADKILKEAIIKSDELKKKNEAIKKADEEKKKEEGK